MSSWIDSREGRVALALALGALLGVERERRKSERGEPAIAGLRTFALVGLLGGVLAYSALPYAVLLGAALVGLFAIVGYAKLGGRDHGITTEVALLLAYVLGALALEAPRVATAAAIATTFLLAVRTRLHAFVRNALSEDELHDGLIFLVLAFVVLPLARDIDLGPYDAVNPQRVARVVVVVTAVSGGGYVARRLLGDRFGLVTSGFAGGFVSSSATIAALGAKAKASPELRSACVAGAAASCLPTVGLYGILVAAVDAPLLQGLAAPLALAGFAALVGTVVPLRRTPHAALEAPRGRAFEWKPAAVVAFGVTAMAIASRALESWVGEGGVVALSAIAGLVDAHATAGSVATLHHGGTVSDETARIAILAALSTNTLTKLVLARAGGDSAYAWRISIVVIGIAVAAWLGLGLG